MIEVKCDAYEAKCFLDYNTSKGEQKRRQTRTKS